LGYYLLPDEMSLSLGYTFEAVQIDQGRDSTNSTPIAGQFRSGTTSALRLSWTWDKRNNRLFPTQGWLSFASVEAAPQFLQGTFNFNRYTAYQRVYFPLPLGSVFKMNLQGGYIQEYSPDNRLPSSELYFLGGINSVRGYQLRTVTPKELVTTSSTPDASITTFGKGGNKQIIFNAELEFPILEKVGIRGVLFYDAGNAFGREVNFFGQQKDFQNENLTLPLGLYHSIGFGVRWFSPIGPLRFEWGIPLTRRITDQPIAFEFTIGNSF
jgi:outer membrane protein insertion porin family